MSQGDEAKKDIESPSPSLSIANAASLREGGQEGLLRRVYTTLCIFILFINYFLAQYGESLLREPIRAIRYRPSMSRVPDPQLRQIHPFVLSG